jgi:hypothetical protein
VGRAVVLEEPSYQTTRRHVPHDRSIHTHCYSNFEFNFSCALLNNNSCVRHCVASLCLFRNACELHRRSRLSTRWPPFGALPLGLRVVLETPWFILGNNVNERGIIAKLHTEFDVNSTLCCLIVLMFFWPCIIVWTCFNHQLTAQFLYSIIVYILHYNPRHASSNTMLILRRSNCTVTASGIVILCKRPHRLSPLSTGALYSHLQSDDTRCCNNTIWPPEDEHSIARNMSRIIM